MPEIKEPDAILIEFAAQLPITIKDVVLPCCCMAFDKLSGTRGQDYFETFCSLLASDQHVVRPYKVAVLCGAMELALEREAGADSYLEKLAKEHPGETTFARMALQAPLKDKHWQQAREQFADLRSAVLSSQALKAWQHYLMVKNPIRLPSFPSFDLDK